MALDTHSALGYIIIIVVAVVINMTVGGRAGGEVNSLAYIDGVSIFQSSHEAFTIE